MIMSLISVEAVAQTSSYGELQAAYLYNFAKYIKWPANPEVFSIGIFGESNITADLVNTLQGKKVGGNPIVVREISSLSNINSFNIIYLPVSNSKSITLLKTAAEGKNILIVSEEDLIKKGASISFVVEHDRLRFKLKEDLLSEAGLQASEGLLKLAILL
jgi:hypothetical protein